MASERKTRWGAVALGVTAGIVAAAYIGKVPPALPMLRAELGLGLVAAGWVVSIFNTMAMTTGMVAGLFADALGHRRVVILGMATMVVGGVIGSVVEGPAALLATRFLEGIGFISIMAAAPSLITEAARPEDRGVALGLWSTFMPAGIAAMLVVSPPVLGAFGWRGLWLAGAAAAFLIAVAIAAAGRGGGVPAAARRTQPGRNVRLTLSRPGPWLLAFSFTAFSLPWSSIMAWLPTFLVEHRGSTVLEAALLTALAVFMNVPGNVLSGWLVQKGVPRWLLVAVPSTLTGLAALGIFSDALDDEARYLLLLAFSFVGGLPPAALITGVPWHAPGTGQLGTTNGFVLQGGNLGQFLGAPLVGLVVATSGGWAAVGWIPAACAVVSVILAFAIRAVERGRAR